MLESVIFICKIHLNKSVYKNKKCKRKKMVNNKIHIWKNHNHLALQIIQEVMQSICLLYN